VAGARAGAAHGAHDGSRLAAGAVQFRPEVPRDQSRDSRGERLEGFLGKGGYAAEVRSAIDARRDAAGFSSDYRAQILEENSGVDYFRALQSLDVEASNSAHQAIAWLAYPETLRRFRPPGITRGSIGIEILLMGAK
jgi:hypothetical protein